MKTAEFQIYNNRVRVVCKETGKEDAVMAFFRPGKLAYNIAEMVRQGWNAKLVNKTGDKIKIKLLRKKYHID